jgi:hypothetical protein
MPYSSHVLLFVLIFSALDLLLAASWATDSHRLDKSLYYVPEDLGVQHLSLPGKIGKTGVILHIYINSQTRQADGRTHARGYFFAEATNLKDLTGSGSGELGLTPWGHSGQPKHVEEWSYPVTLLDKDTGKSYTPLVRGQAGQNSVAEQLVVVA